MSNVGFGSMILHKLIHQYLNIGYIDVHVYDNYIEILFYRGLTRNDLSETHCSKFMSFLHKYGLTQFYSEKKTLSGNPHDADYYWKCTIQNITPDELAGLIRLTKGGQNESN